MAGAVWPIWDLQLWRKLVKKEKTVQETTGGKKKRDGSIQAAGTQRHIFPLFFGKVSANKSCTVFGHEKVGNPESKVRILFYFSP